MAIKSAGITDVFNGQSDIVLFDEVDNYESATIADLTNPISLGQIVQDSTEWTGDDPEVDNILDEQGDIITSSVTAGTVGFNFEMADLSLETIKLFLKGTEIEGVSEGAAWESITKVIGFGYQLPVITRPIMVVNDEMNKAILLPKAKITSNLTVSDGLWRIAATVTGETVDTANLKTCLLIAGKTTYGAA